MTLVNLHMPLVNRQVSVYHILWGVEVGRVSSPPGFGHASVNIKTLHCAAEKQARAAPSCSRVLGETRAWESSTHNSAVRRCAGNQLQSVLRTAKEIAAREVEKKKGGGNNKGCLKCLCQRGLREYS